MLIYPQFLLIVARNLVPRASRADIWVYLWILKHGGGRCNMSVDWVEPQGLQFLTGN